MRVFIFTTLLLVVALPYIGSAYAESKIHHFSYVPECDYKYDTPVQTISGKLSAEPKGDLYCIHDHAEALSGFKPLFDVASRLINPGETLQAVYVSAAFITDESLPLFICSLQGANKVRIKISAQNDFPGENHFDGRVLDDLQGCSESVNVYLIGCSPFSPFARKKVEIYTRCRSFYNAPSTHHIKYLILDFVNYENGTKRSISMFGSGNFFRESLQTNIEDWVLIEEDSAIQSMSWWQCIVTYNHSLAYRDYDSVIHEYTDCKENANGLNINQNTGHDFKYFLMPYERKMYFSSIARAFENAQSAVIVAQFFDSEIFKNMINDNKNVKFTLLLDDAYVVAARTGRKWNYIDPDDAIELLDFINDTDNLQARFLQTNHHYGFHQYGNTVHARSILIRHESYDVYMIGSAHFRDGSFRFNTEQQFIFSGASAAGKVPWFEELLERSVGVGEIYVGDLHGP